MRHTGSSVRKLTSTVLSIFLWLSASAFGQPARRLPVSFVISKVKPVYPAAARKQGIQCAVRLDVVIRKNGHVLKAALISGNPALVDAAKEAGWPHRILWEGQEWQPAFHGAPNRRPART